MERLKYNFMNFQYLYTKSFILCIRLLKFHIIKYNAISLFVFCSPHWQCLSCSQFMAGFLLVFSCLWHMHAKFWHRVRSPPTTFHYDSEISYVSILTPRYIITGLRVLSMEALKCLKNAIRVGETVNNYQNFLWMLFVMFI